MSLVEILGFLFGVAGVWLTIREHWTCFPVGLVNVTLSLFLFYDQKLYSDAIQQAVYIILLSYGWYQWHRGNTKGKEFAPTSLTGFERVFMLVPAAAVSLVLGYLFGRYTDASFPYLDATATSLSFTAQYLIARKKTENWPIWVVVNIMYMGIYFYKELYLYLLLYFIYLLLALTGWSQWLKREPDAETK